MNSKRTDLEKNEQSFEETKRRIIEIVNKLKFDPTKKNQPSFFFVAEIFDESDKNAGNVECIMATSKGVVMDFIITLVEQGFVIKRDLAFASMIGDLKKLDNLVGNSESLTDDQARTALDTIAEVLGARGQDVDELKEEFMKNRKETKESFVSPHGKA